MLSHLRDLIPGAAQWPTFQRNRSEQFEARLSTVLVEQSASILLAGMEGSRIPVVVSHGEGRVDADASAMQSVVSLRYVDNSGQITERYPLNPNGSVEGIAGLCSEDGRFNIMMPHPERVYRTVQHSWAPSTWGEHGPWTTMFNNARHWVDQS
jgi:phosphoribosylformylglycinamidine synthase